MKRYFVRSYVFLVLIAGVIVAVDQWSKSWIRENIAMGEVWVPWDALPFFRIVHWYNTGVAFGMFQGQSSLFTVLAILVAVAILYFYPQVPAGDWVLKVALSMQLGGALGNIIDRIMFGHVTDFIAVGTFPVFNVADSSISVGIGVLIIGMLYQDYSQKRKQSQEAEGKEADGVEKLIAEGTTAAEEENPSAVGPVAL